MLFFHGLAKMTNPSLPSLYAVEYVMSLQWEFCFSVLFVLHPAYLNPRDGAIFLLA